MKNDGEAGQSSLYLSEDIKSQLGLLTGLELECAVAGADSDCERVNAGLGNKFFNLCGIGVGRILCRYVYIILYAGKSAKLALDSNAACMGVFNDLSGDRDVVFKAVLAAVDHYRRKSAVDAGFADLKVIAVVKVKGDIKSGLEHCSLDQLYEIAVLCIFACAGRNLKDKGCLLLHRSFGDALYDLHVVNVERADSVTACVCFFEHFGGVYQCHLNQLLSYIVNFKNTYLSFAVGQLAVHYHVERL